MGIGDKQRIERWEKYAGAIHDVSYGAPDVVDRVLALVDAEIEPLQEQIERDGERIAAQITAAWERNNLMSLLESLPDGIVRNAETRGDLDMPSVYASAAFVRGTVEGHKIKRDHGVKEPEYEYAMRGPEGAVPGYRFESADEAHSWADGSLGGSSYWEIVRRPKPQDWEEIQ